MDLGEEVKKHSYQSEPSFVTVKTDNIKSFGFECASCGGQVKMDFQRQITYSWDGKTNLISEVEETELKKLYGIGLSEKSHDGGFPVIESNLQKLWRTVCDLLLG